MKRNRRMLNRIPIGRVAGETLLELLDGAHTPILQHVRVVVAGVGNLLRGDDGFGVEVARALLRQQPPPGVTVLDIGIGGIHLVQELFEKVDLLVVIDAVEIGRPPGTVAVIRPTIREPTGPDDLADIHYANPERALMLAGALGVLPIETWLVGCQPFDAQRVGEGLSAEVTGAIEPAAAEVRMLVSEFGVPWRGRRSRRMLDTS